MNRANIKKCIYCGLYCGLSSNRDDNKFDYVTNFVSPDDNNWVLLSFANAKSPEFRHIQAHCSALLGSLLSGRQIQIWLSVQSQSQAAELPASVGIEKIPVAGPGVSISG